MDASWDHHELARARAASPLAALVPLVHALLGQAVREASLLVAVTDGSGRLLWLDGDPQLLSGAESGGLMAGTDWSVVDSALTAIGRTLATKAPARSGGPDAPKAVPWAAVAVRDPRSGAVPGALAITGGPGALDPFVLAALRGAASTVESHLATTAAPATGTAPVGSSSARALLRLTGPDAPTLDTPHGTSALNRRHAELLAVLAAAPQGLDGAELTALVYGQPVTSVTLRAEMTRLRKVLEASGALEAGVTLASRPYRLGGVEDDGTRVLAHLARGALMPALSEYGGELLRGSDSPDLARRRDHLAASVREAVLGSRNTEALLAYLLLPEAAEDLEAWETALAALAEGSPRRAAVVAHLASFPSSR